MTSIKEEENRNICTTVRTVTGKTLYAEQLPSRMITNGARGDWSYTQDVAKALEMTTQQTDIFCSDHRACGRVAIVVGQDAEKYQRFSKLAGA